MSYKEKFEMHFETAMDFFRKYSTYITAVSVAVAIGAGVVACRANKNLERGIERYNFVKSELNGAKSKLETCLIENEQSQ